MYSRDRSQPRPFAIPRTFLLGAAAALLAILGIIALGMTGSDAQTTPAKPGARPTQAPAKTPAKPTETAAANPQPEIVESQPVVHARSASISLCLPAISELSRLTLDAPHMALSTWNKTDANDRMFSSIVGLKYENAVAPRAVTIMSAAPNSKRGCDGESVQVQPSTLACDAIQKNLQGPNLRAQDLNGVTLITGEGPIRFALLPSAGNGCTVVAVGTYFAK